MNAATTLPDDVIERAGKFFEARGWEVTDGDDSGLTAVYPASLGGADPDCPRRWLADLGISRLFCAVTPQQVVEIEPCGVLNGCRDHICGAIPQVPLKDVDRLREVLVRYELHARTIDRASLAECVLFGACSRRDFSLANRT